MLLHDSKFLFVLEEQCLHREIVLGKQYLHQLFLKKRSPQQW